MCSQGLIDGDYQMRKVVGGDSSCANCKSYSQFAALSHELCHKIASPTTHYIILMWLLRIIGFLLSLAKWFLVWFLSCFLRWCLHLIHGGFKRYLGAAFLSSMVTSSTSTQDQSAGRLLTYYSSFDKEAKMKKLSSRAGAAAAHWNGTEPAAATHQDHLAPEAEKASSSADEHVSPLLSVVVEDKNSVWQENSQIKDRERLVYEYTKVVAPQVSAFQLGEIVVPIRDIRQLATFLKSKLRDTCRSQPSSETMTATICHLILNLGLSSSSSSAPTKEDSDMLQNRCTSSLVELSAAAATPSGLQPSGSDNTNPENKMMQGKHMTHHAMIYMAAAKTRGRIHLVLVGYKVEGCLGSSEFRSRYNPPVTEKDKAEWQAWNCAHLRALKESSIETAQQLLSVTPVVAQVW